MSLFILFFNKSALGANLTCADIQQLAAAGSTTIETMDIPGNPAVVFTTEVPCIQATLMSASLRLSLYNRVTAAPVTIVARAERAQGIPGVYAEWSVSGCVLLLRLHNTGISPIELDWMRSVWAVDGSPAVPLVPGSSSKLSSMINIPPLVVPAKGFAEELVFRKNNLPSDGDGCLFSGPETATVTLKISENWYTQSIILDYDRDQTTREIAIFANIEKEKTLLLKEIADQQAAAQAQRKADEEKKKTEQRIEEERKQADFTCSDLQGLLSARLPEDQLVEVIKDKTVPSADLDCIQDLGLSQSTLDSLRVLTLPPP